MVRLVDRLTGQTLGTILEKDLEALQAALVAESDDDVDFYLTLDVLDTLQSKGLSESSLAILREVLTARGDLDLGWEPILEAPVARVTGTCRCAYGPLAGLRAELTSEADPGESPRGLGAVAAGGELGRAFTRPDGTFEIQLSTHLPPGPLIVTLMALGDSPLVDLELDSDHDLGEIDLPALRGRLQSPAGALAGALVDATILDYGCDPTLEFATWTVSDSLGQFIIPYPPVDSRDPHNGRLELDLTAASGQPLGTLMLKGPLARPELGDLECEAPDAEWEPSEEARESVERPSDPVYPGVRSHPLE